MQVATRTGPVRERFGHEGDAHVHPVGGLLHALFHEDVAIGHFENIGVSDVHLMLTATPFALRCLDGNPRPAEVAAHRPVVGFRPGSLQQVVVLDIPPPCRQIVVALPGGVAIALFVHEVLEFRGGFGPVAEGGGSLDLSAKDRPWRDGNRLTGAFVFEIAKDDGRCRKPIRYPEGVQVRHHVEVAVAELPVGVLVAGYRFHLHVDGQQVVAGV